MIILGSDINNKLFGKNHDAEAELTQIRLKLDNIGTYLGWDKNQLNINKLFKLEL